MMGNTSNRTGSPVIQFHEDHFTYDAPQRGFFLDEPDNLGVIDLWHRPDPQLGGVVDDQT